MLLGESFFPFFRCVYLAYARVCALCVKSVRGSALHLHLCLIVPLEGHIQGLLQARDAAPESPVLTRVIFCLLLPFPQESQGPSCSVQSSADKLIIQFKTDSTKINSASWIKSRAGQNE